MEFTFTFTTDTLIAILALILAIGSSIYTWHTNKYSIDLFDTEIEKIHGVKLISFTIANTSPKPIRLLNVQLLDKEKVVKDNGFDPVRYEEKLNLQKAEEYDQEHSVNLLGNVISTGVNPYRFSALTNYYGNSSNNFENEVFLLPSENVTFSYFVHKTPDHIAVYSDKPIYRFQKNKSFSVNFYQHQ